MNDTRDSFNTDIERKIPISTHFEFFLTYQEGDPFSPQFGRQRYGDKPFDGDPRF
jgi:hypothetical protein